MLAITSILLAVALSAPFGQADASAVDDREGLTVEVSVEVTGSFEVVIVRPFSSFEELPPTALIDRGDGTWGGTVRLPTAEDWSVVFDAIEPGGEAKRSDTTTLSAMGVDPVVVSGPPDEPLPGRPIPATTWWLIAGIVLALGALGVLAWWTFSGDGDDEDGTVDDGTAGAGRAIDGALDEDT